MSSYLLSGFCLILLIPSAVCSQLGIQYVKKNESTVIIGRSQYAVLLRDLGSSEDRKHVLYGFIEDRYGAQNMYQFNSVASLRGGKPDTVWLFESGEECVPNTAAIYNGILYCRLFTNIHDEFDTFQSNMHISPVAIATFDVGWVPTSVKGGCQPPSDFVAEPKLTKVIEIFKRLPETVTSAMTWLDKFDLKLPSFSLMTRPNMNVRFHVDEAGMWLLAPYQQTRYNSPKLRRLKVDPVTMAITNVTYPAGHSDTTKVNMFGFGIGVLVDGLYYGLSRNGEGSIYFRQRPSATSFTEAKDAFNSTLHSRYVVLDNADWATYISTLQYNPVSRDILLTKTNLSESRGHRFTHTLIPVAKL